MYNRLLIHTILSNKSNVKGEVVEIGTNRWDKNSNKFISSYDMPTCNGLESFYDNLGVDSYFQFEADSIPDVQQFDTVIMAGCSERFFDQTYIFNTLHNLCKKGGSLIYNLSIDSCFGLFTYTPNFVVNLCKDNGYNIDYFAISDRDLRFCQKLDISNSKPYEDYSQYLIKYKEIEAKMALVATKTSDHTELVIRKQYG
jgi:hypothetical protein